jgi:hypothetical protein
MAASFSRTAMEERQCPPQNDGHVGRSSKFSNLRMGQTMGMDSTNAGWSAAPGSTLSLPVTGDLHARGQQHQHSLIVQNIQHTSQMAQVSEKGHAHASSDAVTTYHQEVAGRPRLLLASPGLVTSLGQNYCDDSELLPLLIEHGIIRRVWTTEEEELVGIESVAGQIPEQQSPALWNAAATVSASRGGGSAPADDKQGHHNAIHNAISIAAGGPGGASLVQTQPAKPDEDDVQRSFAAARPQPPQPLVHLKAAPPQPPQPPAHLRGKGGALADHGGGPPVHLKGDCNITLEMLQSHFHLTIVDAARAFDVCLTGAVVY